MTDVSVVIGFRDWGRRRLELALTSVKESFGRYDGEVILSDFGSLNRTENERLAERVGAKYVYSEGEENWSRSRALNAGFSIAQGDILVSTDADMVFTPTSFERIVEIATQEPKAAFFLQCRDLPEGMDDLWVSENPQAWSAMERASRLRPRWGMGGMMAIRREGFDLIRGFDERLHTYGGEDLDFAQRARRAGYRTFWIDDADVRMYHMWHPPTINTVSQTELGQAAVQFNRNVVYNDKTFIRNTRHWKYRNGDKKPIVTVAISTFNRSQFLRETILSVLNQTVQDFEIVIVDDGGTDDTRQVVESFNDPRIRYFWQENQGISAARNHAAQVSRGFYTAVIDDDDLMHPRRLEWQLEGVEAGSVGNVGCFINFEDSDGSMQLFVGKNPTAERAIPKGAAPGHGTWMVQTDVLRKVKYDTTLSSGVDNNIFLRMLRSGYKITHTGKPVTLRRMHPGQVTNTDAGNQTRAAAETLNFLRWKYDGTERKKAEELSKKTPEWPKIDDKQLMMDQARPYLPDHLTTRTVVTSSTLPSLVWDGQAASSTITVLDDSLSSNEGSELAVSLINDASYSDMASLRQAGIDFEVSETSPTATGATFEALIGCILTALQDQPTQIDYVLFVPNSEGHYDSFAGTKEQVAEKMSSLGSPAGSFVVGDDFFEVDHEI